MSTTIAQYTLARLKQFGLKHLFGIPGTSCAGLFDATEKSGVRSILTSSELEAGYAADAYARLSGISAVSVSYGVGTLSMVNAIAGAFTERSPVVVLNGGPRQSDEWIENHYGVLFSHSTGIPQCDLEVYRSVTASALKIRNADEATSAIDRSIQIAVRTQRPVYLEIPSDLWDQPCNDVTGSIDCSTSASGNETEFAELISNRLSEATSPAFLLGVELQRYRLQDEIQELLETTKIPWATTMLAKSVLDERLEGFSGVYDSDLAPKPVRQVVENADVLISLGCVFGVDHTHLLKVRHDQMIHVADGFIRVARDAPKHCDLGTLVSELHEQFRTKGERASWPGIGATSSVALQSYSSRRGWAPESDDCKSLSYEQLFNAIGDAIEDDWLLISDTCLGSYPAADLSTRGRDAFVGNPVWLSIGHSIGAAVGAIHASERRPVVLCGDGGLQTIVQGLSSIAAYGKNLIVIVIDNGIYAIEQYLIDPKFFADPDHEPLPYVSLNRWDYPRVAKGMGFKQAATVKDQETLKEILRDAVGWDSPALISVRIDPRSLPPENQV